MHCACVALLRGRCRVRAGARRAGLPVWGIGYCETVGRYPTPLFSGIVCGSGVYCHPVLWSSCWCAVSLLPVVLCACRLCWYVYVDGRYMRGVSYMPIAICCIP